MECKACGMCKEPYEKAGEVRGRPSLRVSEGLSGNSRETQPGSRTPLVNLRRGIRCEGTKSSSMGAMLDRCFTDVIFMGSFYICLLYTSPSPRDS